ncbi:putative reverse transcriptase domain-containing protein [Tanacetum coccineum]
MKRYGVNHRFSTSHHPQTSGQVKNMNRALKRILEKIVKGNLAIWSRKLDDALWAFRTAYITPTGTTPYKLIYGKNYHLPFEIEHRAYCALKNCNPDLITAGEKRMFQLHKIMPPRRRLKKVSVKRLVEKRVAKAIEEYKKSRANQDSAGSSGGNPRNARGTMNVHGCSHKTFMNGKPHTFNGTEGVVGLRRWIEKVEQVFETCKCAEEDKVMFAASTFEGRALTWWNGNVHTLGLVNANHIPWTEFKTMMTTEYCPAIEIQRMEQEL